MDVTRFALEGEAVKGNEKSLYCSVFCSPKGILEMLWAEAGGSCCRCWGKVSDHSVERPEPVSAAFQVMPLVSRRRDVGARTFGWWRCGWVEGLKFVEDGGIFGVMASFGQEDVDGFPRGVLFNEGADCADGALVQWVRAVSESHAARRRVSLGSTLSASCLGNFAHASAGVRDRNSLQRWVM